MFSFGRFPFVALLCFATLHYAHCRDVFDNDGVELMVGLSMGTMALMAICCVFIRCALFGSYAGAARSRPTLSRPNTRRPSNRCPTPTPSGSSLTARTSSSLVISRRSSSSVISSSTRTTTWPWVASRYDPPPKYPGLGL